MKAEVRIIEGKPALLINGERILPILYGLSDIPGSRPATVQAARNIASFGKAGVHLVVTDADLRLGWHKTTPFDPDPLLSAVAAVRDANPDAYVLLRLHVNPPYFFLRDHPEENVVYRTKEGDFEGIDDGEQERTIAHDGDRHMRAGIASRVFLDAAEEKLRLFLRALKKSPEGEAVFAVQIAYGVYGEWHQWGCDVSAPMQAAFRRHLTERYGTDEALRAAWGREDVSLATAPFHPEIFRPTEDGLFRDGALCRPIEDAQRTLMRTPAEAIARLCHAVKEEVPHMLAGSFFGYFLCGGGEHIVNLGHIGFPYLFDRKDDIDFLAGPFAYGRCRNADRMPVDRALLETMRLHGILWLSEMDQHPAGTEYAVGGDPARADETVAMLRRNVLRPLLAGMGCWYYDHRLVPLVLRGASSYAASIYRKKGWWDTELCMREVTKLQEVAKKCLHSKVISDVLVVYSLDTLYQMYTAPYPDEDLHDALGKSGALYDTVLLEDLNIAELSRYRAVVFANTYRIPVSRVSALREMLKDKTLLFLYAPAFTDGDRLSEENVTALTGFCVERCEPSDTAKACEALGGEAYVNPYGAPVPSFRITGTKSGEAFTPVAYYGARVGEYRTYPDATVMEYPSSLGAVCGARAGNAWYFSAPCLLPSLMREIFREAGAHLYTDSGEPLMGNDKLLLLHTVTGGERVLTLKNGKRVTYRLPPQTALVIDAQSGERLL